MLVYLKLCSGLVKQVVSQEAKLAFFGFTQISIQYPHEQPFLTFPVHSALPSHHLPAFLGFHSFLWAGQAAGQKCLHQGVHACKCHPARPSGTTAMKRHFTSPSKVTSLAFSNKLIFHVFHLCLKLTIKQS